MSKWLLNFKFSLSKADPNIPGEIGAPMKGEVVEMKVAVGDKVVKGQNLAVLSAMKMEMAVQSPVNGEVRAVIGKYARGRL